MIKEFINEYGFQIVFAATTAIAGFIGAKIKQIYEKVSNNRIKKEDAETVVKAVEQLWSKLTGSEKYQKALSNLIEVLGNKGIVVTELEAQMLIESAVSEFNKPWEKGESNG